jgi:hypothetical protein
MSVVAEMLSKYNTSGCLDLLGTATQPVRRSMMLSKYNTMTPRCNSNVERGFVSAGYDQIIAGFAEMLRDAQRCSEMLRDAQQGPADSGCLDLLGTVAAQQRGLQVASLSLSPP